MSWSTGETVRSSRRGFFGVISARLVVSCVTLLLSALAVISNTSVAAAATPSITAPLPINAYANGVQTPFSRVKSTSCSSASWCVAVGDYVASTAPLGSPDSNVSGNSAPYVDTYSSGSWTSLELPVPADSVTAAGYGGAYAQGVSCWAQGACVAVGSYSSSTSLSLLPIAWTLSGGTWTVSSLPTPTNATVQNAAVYLYSISCPTAGSCLAVGSYEAPNPAGTQSTSNLTYEGLSETLSGGSWTAGEIIAPGPIANVYASSQTLNGVSCAVSVSQCVAVGTNTVLNSVQNQYNSIGWIATLNGGSWTSIQSPTPATGASASLINLTSIACPSAGNCVAVGYFGAPTTANRLGMIDELSSSTGQWTEIDAALPSDAATTTSSTLGTYGYDELWSAGCATLSGSSTCELGGEYSQLAYPAPHQSVASLGFTESVTNSGGSWGAPVGAASYPSPVTQFTSTVPGVTPTVTYANPSQNSLSISCVAIGQCLNGGSYFDAQNGENGDLMWSLAAPATDTITFNSEGGTTVANASGLDGTTITLPGAPIYAGHTFAGWFAAPSSGSPLTSPYQLTGSTTLYAQWNTSTAFTVTFMANGGTGTMLPQTSSTATALALDGFTRSGYTFAGWSLTSTSAVVYKNGALFPFTSSLTLYAQWTPNAGGGSCNSHVVVTEEDHHRLVIDDHQKQSGHLLVEASGKSQGHVATRHGHDAQPSRDEDGSHKNCCEEQP